MDTFLPSSGRGPPQTDSLDEEVAAATSRARLPGRGSPSAAAASRSVMDRSFESRRRVKAQMLAARKAAVRKEKSVKRVKERQWKKRMASSPFAVDLVAETERIDEENRVRLRQERRKARVALERKTRLKNTIIRKALTEATDLDTLRQEKRAIIAEERRLKSLLDLEKASAARKQDLLVRSRRASRSSTQRRAHAALSRARSCALHPRSPNPLLPTHPLALAPSHEPQQAAQRAERQRKEAKSEFMRKKRMERLQRVQAEERQMLADLLDVPAPADYGLRIGVGVVGELGGTG